MDIMYKNMNERRKTLWKKISNSTKQKMSEEYQAQDLKIGNKACLELFHREDFPCIKIGKSFLIAVSAFNEYVSTRRVFNETR